MKINKQKLQGLSLILYVLLSISNQAIAQYNEIELWKNGVPNSINTADYEEIYEEAIGRISKVTNPTLTVFVPENPNGTSIVICPGGGYAYLSIKKEGYETAQWFNSLGVTAFVLKYRLPSDDIMQNKSVGPLQDAQESVRYIRRNAEKWQLDGDKIGIIGFSAGGHLAANLSTKYDENTYQSKDTISAKPNFTLLIYPVISMTEEITHKGSKNNLIGNKPSIEMIEKFSTEKQITAQTPPAFLVHASDDLGVPFENSIAYFLGLKKHKIPAEMHLYQNGKHGFGLGVEGTSLHWTKHCEAWLKLNKFVN